MFDSTKGLHPKRGDLPYWSASQLTTLPIGTAGQFLWVASGIPAWASVSSIDHGGLGGLADDDHTQYRLESADHNHESTGLQGGTLGPGAIANRTRRVFVPAVEFWNAATGTPAAATYGGANTNFFAWALDGTNDEAIGCDVFMPSDWDLGNFLNCYIIWCPNDGAGGNVRWILRITSVASGETFNATLETSSGAIAAAAGTTQYARIDTDMGGLAPGSGTASNWLKVLIYRESSNVADTYNGADALVRGLLLQYTADS